MLVGFPAGGTADLIARVVADKMKDSLGQPVIVENRPGAIGRIAADAVKAAAPDGTTLMVMPIGPMAVVPHVYADITYDPVKDFTPVALGATFQFAIAAGPQSGAKNWNEFVAWAKANPGKASYATSGAGSLPHFFGVLLRPWHRRQHAARALQGIGRVYQRSRRWTDSRSIDAIADLTELHRAGRITDSRELRRQAFDRASGCADLRRAGVERRRGDRLVRFFCAGQNAEAHRRRTEPRNQQIAAIA
jgi:hypothetical protein